jgi:hypothetical protein
MVWKIPFIGRVIISTDRFGSAIRSKFVTGDQAYETNLSVVVRDKFGNPRKAKDVMKLNWLDRLRFGNKTSIDLGSGLVTNVGVLALANDYNLAAPSGAAINTLKLANYHVSGTGATAAATTDIKLQTQSTVGGQTPVAGAQSLISAANLQKYQTVATIAYTGTEAVTEWGLLCGTIAGAISGSTGTPFTAGTATSGTVTGTPLVASSATVQGQQQTILENTGNATPHWGLVLSNTTSVVTVPAWYKVSDGTAAGVVPASGNAYTIRPVMWDHKVFAAINVNSGDSIQFTYQLTVVSGG